MRIEKITSIHEVDRFAWNALVPKSFSFARWEHFSCLEKSGSVSSDTGWRPHYLLLFDEELLIGATYLYEKNHSYGEYIFDWEWAHLAEHLRIPYYPKTVSAVPFTPATGSKLLVHPDANPSDVRTRLIQSAVETASQTQSSGLHFLFITPEEIEAFKQSGFFVRDTYQFHWTNKGYKNFEDFLFLLKQKKSKEIRRERRQVRDSGLEVRRFSGQKLDRSLAEFLYFFYLRTIEKKHSYAYLNQEYFYQVFDSLKDSANLFVAFEGEHPIACSLIYHSGHKLYGRYWGALREVKGLHFELCYYLPIEYAIEHDIDTFEAGAQGPHKIQRGFLPEKTHSAHLCFASEFNNIIGKIITHENASLDRGLDEFFKNSPYR